MTKAEVFFDLLIGQHISVDVVITSHVAELWGNQKDGISVTVRCVTTY